MGRRKVNSLTLHSLSIRAYRADDRDWLVERHQTLYTQAEGFDATFGTLVGEILDDFSANHDPDCEAGWIAANNARRVGSIFCVKQDGTTAKLRLFLLIPEVRGLGIGQQLLDHCTAFAKQAGYCDMTLWTHESHRAACALYARNGWNLAANKPVKSFGVHLVEQHWTLSF